jgi:hypothetical protein
MLGDRLKAAASSMFGWPTIRDSALWIGAMARAVNPFRKRTGRTETFAAAMARLDVDDASVARNRRHYTIMMHIHGVAAVAGCAMVVRAVLLGTAGGFAWCGFAVFNAALAFSFSFRAWQIAVRRLGSVADFVRGRD